MEPAQSDPELVRTAIADVVLIRPRVFRDDRGEFFESWQARKYAAAGIDADFVQDNENRSLRHVLRGLHYQVRQPQGKLVRAVAGCVFDVAVDLRRSSATFGHCVGVTLTEESHEALWIPAGFAHGFLVLSDSARFQYKCTNFYAPEHERAIRWDDPVLGIEWPLPKGVSPVLSPKDATAGGFREAECFP
ncbi:MAG: dTDP-4-dehydrorhamnose 3,5-epimerase [Steroidobacteraceae bacterium]